MLVARFLARRAHVVPSLETVQRTLSADIAYTMSRMKVLERLPGNPIGIAYRRIDETAVAFTGRLPAFARVVGLRAGHEHHVEGLMQWYGARGIKPTFEMVPGHFQASLGRELVRVGLFQSGFHASLIGLVGTFRPAADQEEVEQVATAAVLEEFLEAYAAGWGIPVKDRNQFKANVRPWLGQPGWLLYVARCKGIPAAAAILYLHDRIGYLADAATDPTYRRRGLQRALLERRIGDAGASGAEIVFSGAAPFSTSHRNMERVGLRVQFLRALWTPV
jgi:GNAT superfamily N-acetyltransferase